MHPPATFVCKIFLVALVYGVANIGKRVAFMRLILEVWLFVWGHEVIDAFLCTMMCCYMKVGK